MGMVALNIPGIDVGEKDIAVISFEGAGILACKIGGRVLVQVRKICELLGVSVSSQQTRLKRTPALAAHLVGVRAKFANSGQCRECLCIDVEAMPTWLVGIAGSRIREEHRERFEKFQGQVHKVIMNHFFPQSNNAGPSPVSLPSAKIPSVDVVASDLVKPGLPADSGIEKADSADDRADNFEALAQMFGGLAKQARAVSKLRSDNEFLKSQLAQANSSITVLSSQVCSAVASMTKSQNQIDHILKSLGIKEGWNTIVGYCNSVGRKIDNARAGMVGKYLTAQCRAQGFEPGSCPHPYWDSVNVYPISMLESYFRNNPLT